MIVVAMLLIVIGLGGRRGGAHRDDQQHGGHVDARTSARPARCRPPMRGSRPSSTAPTSSTSGPEADQRAEPGHDPQPAADLPCSSGQRQRTGDRAAVHRDRLGRSAVSVQQRQRDHQPGPQRGAGGQSRLLPDIVPSRLSNIGDFVQLNPKIVASGVDDNGTTQVSRRVEAILAPVAPFCMLEARAT